MKIKRTTAPDMRTAMKLIREEQGPDAVILGNRRVPGGIEIVSAIDYEAGAVDSSSLFSDNPSPSPASPSPAREAPAIAPPALAASVAARTPVAAPAIERSAAVQQDRWDSHNKTDLDDAERSVRRATELLRAARAAGKAAQKPVARPAEPQRLPPAVDPLPELDPIPTAHRSIERSAQLHVEPAPAPAVAPMPAPPPVAKRAPISADTLSLQTDDSSNQIQGMQQELQAMRELMTQQLSVMGWGNVARHQPARVNLLTRLHHMGLGTDLALKLCDSVDAAADPKTNWRDALAMLQAQIPESREDMVEHGGVFALVGATGVGKTTAIAKLAAHCAMRHGKQSVALISTDNMRVGAREQLRSFAAILDVPLVFCESPEQLEREVQRLRERKLVLIDTAGLSVKDPRMGQNLAQIRRVKTIQPLLTLPANGQLGVLEQTCRVFSNCDPVGCIVSKVDEAYSMGAVMTKVVEYKIPLTWFGTGQRVPEDLTRASAAGMMRLSLGTEALRKPTALDADELASHFGQASVYSNA